MEITGKTSTRLVGKRFGEVFLQFHFVKVPETDMMIFLHIYRISKPSDDHQGVDPWLVLPGAGPVGVIGVCYTLHHHLHNVMVKIKGL